MLNYLNVAKNSKSFQNNPENFRRLVHVSDTLLGNKNFEVRQYP